MKKGLQKKILGFTLVEIMIVVTIIGILASLAVPAFQRARWKALETSIRNNLRQIWGAAQQYMLENGVNYVNAMDIVAWQPKNQDNTNDTNTNTNTNTTKGTNLGYTSVIQQISDEEYNLIGIYLPKVEGSSGGNSGGNSSETTDDTNTAKLAITSFSSDPTGTGNSILTADTQGLFIKVGDKWVKLRL